MDVLPFLQAHAGQIAGGLLMFFLIFGGQIPWSSMLAGAKAINPLAKKATETPQEALQQCLDLKAYFASKANAAGSEAIKAAIAACVQELQA